MPAQDMAAADDSPFRVLGIALVAEEVGKGARLVFRYPAVAPPLAETGGAGVGGVGGIGTDRNPTPGSEQPQQDPAHNTNTKTGASQPAREDDDDGSADLFFSLPDRTVAKLFRPKPALCGQPMTLSVGGTVFCCRAIELRREGGASTAGGAAATGSSAEPPLEGASASAAAAAARGPLRPLPL